MSFLLSAYGTRSHCPVPFLSRPLYSCLTSSSYKHSFASCTLKSKPLYWSHIPLLSLFSSQKGNLNLLFYFFTSTAQFAVKKKKSIYLHTLEILLKSLWPLLAKFNKHASLYCLTQWWHLMPWAFPSLLGFFQAMVPPLLLHKCTFYYHSFLGMVLLCFVLHLFSLHHQMLLSRALSLVLLLSYKISWENESALTTSFLMTPTFKSLVLNSLLNSYLWLPFGYFLHLHVTKSLKIC